MKNGGKKEIFRFNALLFCAGKSIPNDKNNNNNNNTNIKTHTHVQCAFVSFSWDARIFFLLAHSWPGTWFASIENCR